MVDVFGVPLHPAIVHFPVAGSVFAALALGAGLSRSGPDRAVWRDGASLLLAATLLGQIAAAVSGHFWADGLGLLPGGGLLPSAATLDGFLRRHVLLSLGAFVATALALALARRAVRHPGAFAWASAWAALAATLLLLTAHHGGVMVYTKPLVPAVSPER